MLPPFAALAEYSADVAAGSWDALPDAGGLSGAAIWRSERGWRLKAWPDVSAEHLRQTHVWMRQAATLDFVPRVAATKSGDTVVSDGPWTWDVVAWMPGEPLSDAPTPERLTAAGRALAALHVAWQATTSRIGPCPAIQRRLDALARVPDLDDSPARPVIDVVRRHAAACRKTLTAHLDRDERLHPCLCDLRPDHVLFADNRVTGFIDFGAMQVDHPAVDLARLLGDCLPGDARAWQPLLDAYHSIRPLTPSDHRLVGVLEETGAVVSLLTWIDRLRQRALTPAEHHRLTKLLDRVTK